MYNDQITREQRLGDSFEPTERRGEPFFSFDWTTFITVLVFSLIFGLILTQVWR